MFKQLIPRNKKLTIATLVYWFLLLYMISALIWWFISLMQQSSQMTEYQLLELKADDPAYLTKITEIREREKVNFAKYTGEGVTFLALILLGAAFVYRSVRKEFRLAHQQRNFMMAVTHELKTPIAVVKLNLETLQKHKLEAEKEQKIINMTLQETDRLSTLAGNILVSAQMDENAYASINEAINFSDILKKTAKEYETRFPAYRWKSDIQEEIHIEGDPLLLQMLVSNLVDNAVKYSPKGSLVAIALAKDNNKAVFTVADNGIGIPDSEKKKVFRRFYRIGNEATRTTKGTGLGLYLCRKIAAYHKAVIAIKDNQPEGTVFTIYFQL